MSGRPPSLRGLLSFSVVPLAVGAAVLGISLTSASTPDQGAARVSARLAVKASQLRDPATPGRVVFLSNFERSDFRGWYVQALPGRVRLVHGSPYEGRANARFEVRPGDVEPDTGSQRAEVSGPDFHEGEDLYVRVAIRVPRANSFRGPWQLVQQFHEDDWGGSPGTAVFLTSGRRLRLGHGDGTQIDWEGPQLRVGRWYDLVYRVKLSRDPRVGLVEVWLDGRRQRLSNGRFREYGWTMQQPHVYLKTGIYRDSTSSGTSVVEDDSVIVVQRRAPRRRG